MKKMINSIDYIFGLAHMHTNDQLNMVYTVKFSNSAQLDDLCEKIKKKFPRLNAFYKELYAPFFSFENLSSHKRKGDVLLLNDLKYKDLDLENHEFCRLDCLKNGRETEFVFTGSHIMADGISGIAMAYYLLNDYSVDEITSYVNYPLMKRNLIDYLKQTSFKELKAPKIFNYLKTIKSKSTVSLKKRNIGTKSVPDIVKTTFDISVAREKSKKYKISRENYLLLKLAEAIFRYRPDKDDGDECSICLSKDIRLNSVNLFDVFLGNYSSSKIMKFARQENISFEKFVEKYREDVNDKSYSPELIQKWLSIQKTIRLPKALLNLLIKSSMFNPSKYTATFSYIPLRSSILFPQEFFKKYNTTLIDYDCFLRVVKKHVPSFVFYPNPSGNYSLSLTFNHAFMDKTEADRLLKLYKDSLMEV